MVRCGEDHELVMKKVDDINKALKQAKIRVKVDDRLNIRPGMFLTTVVYLLFIIIIILIKAISILSWLSL
jgi:hypothetical protein